MAINLTPIRDLSYEHIDTKPRDYDFGQGYPETWEYFEADECGKCGSVLLVRGEEQHWDLDDETECEGWLSSGGPMMNYMYPINIEGGDEAALKIAGLPLCVVLFEEDEEYFLALTGGGMNLKWEICEAYMRLGFLPPLHFCNLPEYAGKQLSLRNQWILNGCLASAKGVGSRAERDVERLEQLRKSMLGGGR